MSAALIGAAGAGLALVGAGGWWWLRGRAPSRISSPEQAAEAAERALPGFVVAGAVVGADGGAALAVAANGRVAAVAPQGGGLLVREVAWRSLRAMAEGVMVETGDRRLGTVALAGVDVLDIRRLAPKGVAA